MTGCSADLIGVLYVVGEQGTDIALRNLERTHDQFTVSVADGGGTVGTSDADCLLVDGPGFDGSLEGVLDGVPSHLPVVLVIGEDDDVPTDESGSVLATEFIRRRDAAEAARLATRVRSAVARSGPDQRDRQQILRELHDVATELPEYDSVEAVCERTVEAAETVLEFDNCVITLAEGDRMRLVALSDEFPGRDFDSLPIDNSYAGYIYRTGGSSIADDISNFQKANPQGPYRSGMSIALDDHGTCQMISERVDAFDEGDKELAELLVAHTESALDRLTRETELRAQNERLEEFANVLTHDLRNPLNVAQGRLDLAHETGDTDQLEVALDALDRMETLIDNLLTLARDGEDLGERQEVSLETVARACWRTVETEAATLEMGRDVTLRADRSRLQQLLANLTRNAIDHAGDDVAIEIGGLDDGFYVADDGPGIPPAERDSVFEVGHSTGRGGTGFGLAIVERIVDAHGWAIDVDESETGGARFVVSGVGVVA
jgi:signal transduction histidine kinase